MGGKSKKSEDAGYFLLAVVAIIAAPFILAYYVLKWILGGIANVLVNPVGFFVLALLFILIVFGVYYAISQRNR